MHDVQKFTAVLFTLPDERIVLQRRTADAPYAPGLLGAFGGWVDANETVEACLAREISEETSLDIATLKPRQIAECTIAAGDDFPIARHFYIFEAPINTMDFTVNEGDRAEVYTFSELQKRSDLSGALRHTLNAIRTTYNKESETA